MTKPYHKPPTSIDQAQIIPFPNINHNALEKMRQSTNALSKSSMLCELCATTDAYVNLELIDAWIKRDHSIDSFRKLRNLVRAYRGVVPK